MWNVDVARVLVDRIVRAAQVDIQRLKSIELIKIEFHIYQGSAFFNFFQSRPVPSRGPPKNSNPVPSRPEALQKNLIPSRPVPRPSEKI